MANSHEHLTKNLEVLVNNAKIGFLQSNANDMQSVPSNPYEALMGFEKYHFAIHVPYCGRKLNWEIIFDPENLSELPDFNFNDPSFLAEPDINYIAQHIPSWDHWNLANSHAILNILNEFLALFKKLQIEKLCKQNMYANFRMEYENLLKINGMREEYVEVYIENKGGSEFDNDCSFINLQIYLPIDFSELPEYYQEEFEEDELLNPGEDFARLHFEIRKPDNAQTKLIFQLSPRVEQVLGKSKLVKQKKDLTITQQVKWLQNTIKEHIQIIAEQYHKKNLFASTVVNTFSSSIVEYNNRLFNKIVFIYEDYEEYDCLVTISLGLKFPQDKPKILLSSLYCQVGKTCNHPLVFDYNSGDSVEAMLQNIQEALKEQVKIFLNHKHC
ncbi:BRISC and BRCA1-A complex member 2-like [Cylas formicarius]|uniref:BRISC and BRCA1-A complex member 2-like n=1 Tax=Cylas formicarius TaxID=197179 RepID=UPI0029584C62|nr:BRISC and BRCA1-A complex member 2-like [Cylas formicarius]